MEGGHRSDPARSMIRVLISATAVGALAYAAFIAAGQPAELTDAASIWIYHATLPLATATCFVGAATLRDQRGVWTAFGLGLLSWTAADLYWTLVYTNVASTPYPSLADAGYLAALPCFYVGIALLIKRRVGHFTLASWLDGAIGGLAAAALGTALLAPALVGLTKGSAAAVLTNLAYPLGDVLLVAFILGALVVSGLRGAGAFLAIIAGLITWTIGDGIYLYQQATSAYGGGWLDEVWLIGPLLIASGVALNVTHAPRRRAYSAQLALPALFAAIAVGVLVWDHFSRQHEVSVWLAAATLAAVIIRMGISFRENGLLLAALDDDASTDPLTELGNRRKLMSDLEAAIRSGAATPDHPSSRSTTWTGSSATTTPTGIRRATASCAGWAPTWPGPSRTAAPIASAGMSSASSSRRAAGPRSRSSRRDGKRSPSAARAFRSAPRPAPWCSPPTPPPPARHCGSPTAASTRTRTPAAAASTARATTFSWLSCASTSPSSRTITRTSRGWRSRSVGSSSSTPRRSTSCGAQPSSTTSARSRSRRTSCESPGR